MQDEPKPAEILTAVGKFLRETVIPESTPHTGFQARLAANALDLVIRQISLAPVSDQAERARLRDLLGQDGDLPALNQQLSSAIAAGALNPARPDIAAHLWASTLEKLAVDQPAYSGYRAALANPATGSTTGLQEGR